MKGWTKRNNALELCLLATRLRGQGVQSERAEAMARYVDIKAEQNSARG